MTEPYPTPSLRDAPRVITDIALAAIPDVGGSLQTFFHAVVEPGIEKRRRLWLNQLALAVARLEAELGDLEQLSERDDFLTAVRVASEIALGTHLEEKHEKLRNGICRVGVDKDSDSFMSIRLLRLLDELDPEHTMVLQYSSSPRDSHPTWGADDFGTPIYLLERASLVERSDVLEIVLSDLERKRLIDTARLERSERGAGALEPFATELGVTFLRFIDEF